MSQSSPTETADAAPDRPPVVVKKYANRRLYNTESSSYITLDTLAEMVRDGRDFVVFDAKTGEDITRSVLTQIIVEEESKGRAMLPTGFLRQLIGFYGDSMQSAVPKYLENAMSAFARQQEQVSRAMQQTMGPFFPPALEEVGRKNMAMMERAMSLFTPFLPHDPRADAATRVTETDAVTVALEEELASLRAEVEALRSQLVQARAMAPRKARAE